VQNFQKILKDRGYYTGAIDGIVGPLTLAGAKAMDRCGDEYQRLGQAS
jgi:lysozyme family protein